MTDKIEIAQAWGPGGAPKVQKGLLHKCRLAARAASREMISNMVRLDNGEAVRRQGPSGFFFLFCEIGPPRYPGGFPFL